MRLGSYKPVFAAVTSSGDRGARMASAIERRGGKFSASSGRLRANKKGAGGALCVMIFVRRSASVLLAELVHPAARVDDLLLARVERMAVRADFDLQIMAEGRARNERVTAAAGHGRVFVLRVNSGFHDLSGEWFRPLEKRRAV